MLWVPWIDCSNCAILSSPDGYDLTVDTIENDLSATETLAYGDGSYFSGDMYETTVASGAASAPDFNFLLVNDWYDAAGPTTHHGIAGLSAKPFEQNADLLV